MNDAKRDNWHIWAFAGFVILSIWGVALRYMQLFPLPGFNYMFLLHGHSHFAFAGWMFFSLAILIAKSFTGISQDRTIANIWRVTLLSAFGMLVSFSLQGYKAVSISFSTLFIVVTYWFSWVILKGIRADTTKSPIAKLFLTASLAFLCLSSLGPFALGPITALGYKNTSLYQNAIYFYLHFQLNGWMPLAVLAVFVNDKLPTIIAGPKIKIAALIFIFSTIPLYAIFILWTNPSTWVWFLAFTSASFSLASWLYCCYHLQTSAGKLSPLLKAGLLAFTLKALFQLAICIPAIAQWTMSNRNLIIGYIHLITLGAVMPLILDEFESKGYFKIGSPRLCRLHYFFIGGVVFYLGFLFIQPLFALMHVPIPFYQQILLLVAVYFLGCGTAYLTFCRRRFL